jgi:hypothetical protein
VSAWLLVWLIVGIVTTAVLVLFGLALVRHGLIVIRAARQMADETAPLARDISDSGAAASERANRSGAAAGAARRPHPG